MDREESKIMFVISQWLVIIGVVVMGVTTKSLVVILLALPAAAAFVTAITILDDYKESLKLARKKCVKSWNDWADEREKVNIYKRALEMTNEGFNKGVVDEYVSYMLAHRSPSIIKMDIFQHFINRDI